MEAAIHSPPTIVPHPGASAATGRAPLTTLSRGTCGHRGESLEQPQRRGRRSTRACPVTMSTTGLTGAHEAQSREVVEGRRVVATFRHA